MVSKLKVLVTGAGGFVGRALVKRLTAQGHEVTSFRARDIDIAYPFELMDTFDAVVHLAAYNITNVGAKDEDMYRRINVEGTRHVIDAVNTRHFIFMSTAKVYRNDGEVIDEDSPIEPQGAYALSKWDAEEICRISVPAGQLTIVRPTNIAGEGQAVKAIVPVLVAQARSGEPLYLSAHPSTRLQLLYVEDAVDALVALVEYGSGVGVINLAPAMDVTLGALAAMVIEETRSASVIQVPLDNTPPTFAPVSAARATRELHWTAKTLPQHIVHHTNAKTQL